MAKLLFIPPKLKNYSNKHVLAYLFIKNLMDFDTRIAVVNEIYLSNSINVSRVDVIKVLTELLDRDLFKSVYRAGAIWTFEFWTDWSGAPIVSNELLKLDEKVEIKEILVRTKMLSDKNILIFNDLDELYNKITGDNLLENEKISKELLNSLSKYCTISDKFISLDNQALFPLSARKYWAEFRIKNSDKIL